MNEQSPIIPNAVRHIDYVVEPLFERAQDRIADDIAEAGKASIENVGAVASRDYLNAVDVREAQILDGVRERMIDADGIGYSDIVERGWLHRAHGQESYPGRYPLQKAIESSEMVIASELDEAGRALQNLFA